MLRRVVAVCAAALVLAACTSEAGAPEKTPEETPESSVLDRRLSDTGACSLTSDAAVEKAFGAKVTRVLDVKHVRVEHGEAYECDYGIDGISHLSTVLSTTSPEDSDQEVLDRVFTDTIKEERPVTEYEEVPDLGTSARFGQNVTIEKYVGSWKLCVLSDLGGERLLLTLTAPDPVELDQLRPLAEEALSNLAG
jgi:hypothetical protein